MKTNKPINTNSWPTIDPGSRCLINNHLYGCVPNSQCLDARPYTYADLCICLQGYSANIAGTLCLASKCVGVKRYTLVSQEGMLWAAETPR